MTERAGRNHPMPGYLVPVMAYVNTVDDELGTDDWAPGPAALAAWLLDKGLVAKAVRVTQVEFDLAVNLRIALRTLTLVNNGHFVDAAEKERIAALLRTFPLAALPDAEPGPTLSSLDTKPVPAALGDVVARYATAVAAGQWHRLRRCPADDCAWVFWDSSAKGARRWCTMRVCGNRAKARAFAERQAADAVGDALAAKGAMTAGDTVAAAAATPTP